jgi:hypothetical protein
MCKFYLLLLIFLASCGAADKPTVPSSPGKPTSVSSTTLPTTTAKTTIATSEVAKDNEDKSALKKSSSDSSVTGLLIAGLITGLFTAIGYIVKSVYEFFLSIRTRTMQSIEEKLKLFYWPLLFRLEKDNAVWEGILSKRQDASSLPYRIADSVEKQTILVNHQEILAILDNYTYLAEPDDFLTDLIKKYVKNITLYKALRDAGNTTDFPFNIDPSAKYPQELYEVVKTNTKFYQRLLNTISFTDLKPPSFNQ